MADKQTAKPISFQQIAKQVSDELAERFDASLAPNILKLIESGVNTLSKNIEKRSIPIIDKHLNDVKIRLQQNASSLAIPEQPVLDKQSSPGFKIEEPRPVKTDRLNPLFDKLEKGFLKILPIFEKRNTTLLKLDAKNDSPSKDLKTTSSLQQTQPITKLPEKKEPSNISSLIESITKKLSGEKKEPSNISSLVESITKKLSGEKKEPSNISSLVESITKNFSEFKDNLSNFSFKDQSKQDQSTSSKRADAPKNLEQKSTKKESSSMGSSYERLFREILKQSNLNKSSSNDKEKKTESQQPKSLLEAETDSMKVVFDGFTDKGVIELTEKLPKILHETFKELLKDLKPSNEKDKDKKPSGFLEFLGSIISPKLLKGAMSALAGVGGLLLVLDGMTTSAWYKGLEKIVGKGLLNFSGFTKKLDKFIGGLVSKLIKIPARLIGNLSKSFMGLFGKEIGATAIKTGLGASKGFLPKLLGGILKFVKKVPFVGSLISIGFAVDRFRKGDIVGGGLEVLSGVAGAFGLTPLSWAIDGLNAFLDFKAGGIGEGKKGKGAMIMDWVKGMGSWMWNSIQKLPIIGPAIKGVQSIFSGKFLDGLKFFAEATPIGALVSFFAKTETGKKAISATGNWLKNIGSWINEKFSNMPVFGPLIKSLKYLSALEWKKGLKQLLYVYPGFEVLGSLLGDTDTSGMSQKSAGNIKNMWGWTKQFASSIWEKLKKAPVIGKAIDGMQLFLDGNWMEGLKTLSGAAFEANPIRALIDWIAGPDATKNAITGAASAMKSGLNFLGELKDKMLRKILEYIPEKIMGISVRGRVAGLLGIKLDGASGDETAQVTAPSSPTVPAPQQQQPTVQQAGDAVVDPKKGLVVSSPKEGAIVQLSKKDGIVAGPIVDKDSKQKDSYPKHLTSASNLEILRNKKMDEVAENTRKTYKGIEHLTQSIALLAKALEKTTGASPTIINAVKGGSQPKASVTMTQIAQQGNPDIRNVRSTFTKAAY